MGGMVIYTTTWETRIPYQSANLSPKHSASNSDSL